MGESETEYLLRLKRIKQETGNQINQGKKAEPETVCFLFPILVITAYLALCIEAEHIKEQQFTNFSSYQFVHSPKCSSTYHFLLYSYEIISYSHINCLSMQKISSIFPIMLWKTDIWQDQINQ